MSSSLAALLLAIPGAQLIGDPATPISALTYDSRKVTPGALFVAIKGQHVDGHAYIEQAIARGAAAVVVDRRYWSNSIDNLPLIITPNSLSALAPIAAAFYGYPSRELGLIGVTGTKGKSTTTDLIAQILEDSGHTSGMISTVDFKIGPRRWSNETRQSTPEAPEIQAMLREMVAAGCTIAVIEATSHALAARWNRLGGCAFDVAVMLNVTHEHLDFHGSFEQYRADKARLFTLLGEEMKTQHACADGTAFTTRHSPAKQEKWAIVNADDPGHHIFLEAAPPGARRLTFGIDQPADVRAVAIATGPGGSQVHVQTPWGSCTLQVPLPGRFNIANALAALSVALSQQVTLEQAAAALARVRGPRGRMEPVEAGQPFTVIVDYAHNPDSFTQIMSMLRPLTQGRMIAVFGSAGERDREKRPLQGAIAAHYCDLLVFTDEDPRGEESEAIIAAIAAGAEQAGKHADTGYMIIPDRTTAIHAALAAARPGDLVLLLGKGHEGSIIYNGYSLPWNEAAVARAALAQLGYESPK